MRVRKFILPGSLILILLVIAGFTIWAQTTNEPMAEAQSAMLSDSQVIVEQDPWLVFRPAKSTPTIGFIYYPGGRVDPRAYAPMARAIAQQGYLAVIVPMPLNLAVFGAGRAQEVIEAYPEIDHWALGGHSLGGAMAAHFVYNNPGLIQGLVLLASYPASSDNLSQYEIEVISIYGTRDGVMAEGALEDSLASLPSDTHWIAIDGGNHAQFGWYGDQSGDQPASISRVEQQQIIVDAILNLLESLGNTQVYRIPPCCFTYKFMILPTG